MFSSGFIESLVNGILTFAFATAIIWVATNIFEISSQDFTAGGKLSLLIVPTIIVMILTFVKHCVKYLDGKL